jgi:hypothetical protein
MVNTETITTTPSTIDGELETVLDDITRLDVLPTLADRGKVFGTILTQVQ